MEKKSNVVSNFIIFTISDESYKRQLKILKQLILLILCTLTLTMTTITGLADSEKISINNQTQTHESSPSNIELYSPNDSLTYSQNQMDTNLKLLNCKNYSDDEIINGQREITFAGYKWVVRNWDGSPGPNCWTNSKEDVWVDSTGRLHLTIKNVSGTWRCSQIISKDNFGFGTYRFYLDSRVDQFDKNSVVGLYTFEDNDHEIDIEFSRWGRLQANYLHYTSQPSNLLGNQKSYNMLLTENETINSFIWKPTSIEFSSVEGHNPSVFPFANWVYLGNNIPQNETTVRMNLWLVHGNAPTDGKDIELVVSNFEYIRDEKYYYVSPAGNDTNSGNSPTHPWKTLANASKKLKQGQTLYIMDGTYENDTLRLTASNITVLAYSGTPIIKGGIYGIIAADQSNICISGLTLTNQTSDGIYVLRSNNVTVENCNILHGNNGITFRECNDTFAHNNRIDDMKIHGIHIFCQTSPKIFTKNNVVGNEVSNCGHNMIDVHSNNTYAFVSKNNVYFTDNWSGNKNNLGILAHNGNVPYLIIENNTIHDIGRPLQINNVNDAIVRNNYFYNGTIWGNSKSASCIVIGAENGSVPCSPFGSSNITFDNNIFENISYPIVFYSRGVTDVKFKNINFENNTYLGINKIKNLRIYTPYIVENIVFKNERFDNFTIGWEGNTIDNGDIKFENNILYPIYSNSKDNNYSVLDDIILLNISNKTTDIWYGDIPLTKSPSNFSNITADIGNPNRINVNYMPIYNTAKYSKFAYRYNCSNSTNIDEIGFYRYKVVGTGGEYSLLIVNDDNGLPGNIVYARNCSFKAEKTSRGIQKVKLNKSITLDADTPYWIIFDGKKATLSNYIGFTVIDRELEDRSYGFDYIDKATAGWEISLWKNGAKGSAPVYGVVWGYNNCQIVDDEQIPLREDTRYIYGTRTEGNKIINAPNITFTVSSVSAKLDPVGTYQELYFCLANSSRQEIVNRTIIPIDNEWDKVVYKFNPEIEVGAGNSTIYAYFSSPASDNISNGYQIRAIEYLDEKHSYPCVQRYSTSDATVFNLINMDTMLNMSISYVEIK